MFVQWESSVFLQILYLSLTNRLIWVQLNFKFCPCQLEFDFLFQINQLKCGSKTIYFAVPTHIGSHKVFTQIYLPLLDIVRLVCPVIITVATTAFLVKFLLQRKNIRETVLNRHNAPHFKNQTKADQLDNLTVVLVLVALCFVLCISPLSVSAVLYWYLQPSLCSTLSYILVLGQLSTAVNSSINFVIYCAKIPAFQNTLKEMLCRKFSAEASPIQTHVSVVESTNV